MESFFVWFAAAFEKKAAIAAEKDFGLLNYFAAELMNVYLLVFVGQEAIIHRRRKLEGEGTHQSERQEARPQRHQDRVSGPDRAVL